MHRAKGSTTPKYHIFSSGPKQEESAHVMTCTQNILQILSNLWVRSSLARGGILYLILTILYHVRRIYEVSCEHLQTTCGKIAL